MFGPIGRRLVDAGARVVRDARGDVEHARALEFRVGPPDLLEAAVGVERRAVEREAVDVRARPRGVGVGDVAGTSMAGPARARRRGPYLPLAGRVQAAGEPAARAGLGQGQLLDCLLYTSPSPRD